MLTNFSINAVVFRLAITAAVILAAVALPCYVIYIASDSAEFRIPFHDYGPRDPHIVPLFPPDDDSSDSVSVPILLNQYYCSSSLDLTVDY